MGELQKAFPKSQQIVMNYDTGSPVVLNGMKIPNTGINITAQPYHYHILIFI